MASQHHINHLVPTGEGTATGDASHLGRLNDLDEYKVADGYPDIRGWDVRTSDGSAVGKVGDLIVDTAALRVRYLDVEVDRSVAKAA
ncbi:MAG TPA: PRC-barrel domain-containing protein, partial [Gemmatirosa sp.]